MTCAKNCYENQINAFGLRAIIKILGPIRQKKNWSELNWPELTQNKSTLLHDAFIGHTRERHDSRLYD